LYRFDPTTGAGTFVGGAGLYNTFKGDLDYDAASGKLYGLVNAPDAPTAVRQLFTVDRHTGAATVVGPIPGVADPSAMAFAPDGTLYVLDTFYQRLLTVNKADASVSKYVPLSKALGPVAGMDFDPTTGVLYVGDGDGTSNSLYSLNTTTGTLSLIGPLAGSPAGISALTFVPEPAGVLALFAVPLLSRGRRRGR
jgi:DNA-binding beta-propeller fold protein YncE